jgi:hypothetical protein
MSTVGHCPLCVASRRSRPEPLQPLQGTLVVDGLLRNDRWSGNRCALEVVETTGQIYCPWGVGSATVAEYVADLASYSKPYAHLFVHQMPIGSVIAIPMLDAEPLDGYASDDTDAEYSYSLREALLVRITSEVKAGPMKGRSFLRDTTYSSWNTKYCSLDHTPLDPGCWQCWASCQQLLLNEAATEAKTRPSRVGAPKMTVEDFVALHRDVEVLGKIRPGGCEDPHYFEWNYGSIKCTQTRVYTASILK